MGRLRREAVVGAEAVGADNAGKLVADQPVQVLLAAVGGDPQQRCERRQVCWSHLRRDFTFHADLGSGPQEAFGLDGLEVTWNIFHAWKQFQEDGDRDALQRRVEQIKAQMRPLFEWGLDRQATTARAGARQNLLKLWPALWTFADIEDVEPTNNAAERGLRAAVIYRKLSFGSRSQGGERTIERLLSVDQTCRLQRRSLCAYLVDALTAKARGDPVPHPQLTGESKPRAPQAALGGQRADEFPSVVVEPVELRLPPLDVG